MLKPVGVYGGLFDPVHMGHLRPALEALETLELEEVRFIPCRQPAHKPAPIATARERVILLKLAINDQPGFVIDERELKRPDPSYMVDTLQSLKNELLSSLCLIIGSDAFCGFNQWHEWRRILTLAHLVVTTRPGSTLPSSGVLHDLLHEKQTTDKNQLRDSESGLIYIQPVTQLAISSSNVRDRIERHQSPRYLLPNAVWRYIKLHGLYR